MSNFLKLVNLPEAEGLSQIELDLNRRAKIAYYAAGFFFPVIQRMEFLFCLAWRHYWYGHNRLFCRKPFCCHCFVSDQTNKIRAYCLDCHQ